MGEHTSGLHRNTAALAAQLAYHMGSQELQYFAVQSEAPN